MKLSRTAIKERQINTTGHNREHCQAQSKTPSGVVLQNCVQHLFATLFISSQLVPTLFTSFQLSTPLVTSSRLFLCHLTLPQRALDLILQRKRVLQTRISAPVTVPV